MRKLISALFIFNLLYFGFSDTIPRKLVVILIDLSESTNRPEIREAYSQNLRFVFSKIKHGDALFVAKITSQSEMEQELLAQETFPPFKPKVDTPLWIMKEKEKEDQKLKEKLEGIYSDIDSKLKSQQEGYQKTSILGSLKVAERIFKNNNCERKILLIFSDMIEDSEFYNFERENLTERSIERIIEREEQQKRIPELHGVKVYVAGARAQSTKKYEQIKKFWLRYFQRAGASLPEECYGAVLLRFEE